MAFVNGTLVVAVFVLQAECPNAADIVDRQEIIHGIERPRFHHLARTPSLLAALGMIPLYDPLPPAIGLGVGDGRVKHRSIACLAVKLRATHQRQAGLDREAVRRSEPIDVILKGSTFARALLVIAEHAYGSGFLAEMNGDDAPHSGRSVLRGRTRLGRRSASSSSP